MDPLAVGPGPGGLDKIGAFIQNRQFCAEGLDKGGFGFGADGGADPCASDLGQLDGDVAHSSGSAMDEGGLDGLEATAIVEGFPSGDENEGSGGGLGKGEGFGFGGDEALIDDGIFGIVARWSAEAAVAKVDFIANFEAFDVAPDCGDDACAITTEDGGGTIGVEAAPLAQFGVDRVNSGGFELNEQVGAVLELGVGEGLELEGFGGTGGGEDDGFHGGGSGGSALLFHGLLTVVWDFFGYSCCRSQRLSSWQGHSKNGADTRVPPLRED